MESLNEQTKIERPRDLNRAIQILTASLAIGLLTSIIRLSHIVSGAAMIYSVVIAIAFFAIFFFILMKISAGRNWARILWVVLILSQLGFAIYGYSNEVRTHVLTGTLGFIVLILQIVGTYLLFTKPSNLWFRTRE